MKILLAVFITTNAIAQAAPIQGAAFSPASSNAISITPPTEQITLYWSLPTNSLSSDLQFIIYQSATVAQPLSNWIVLTNLTVSNLVVTNLDTTGTNAVFSASFQVVPAQWYFSAQCTNFWGLTTASNYVSTPPAPPTNGLTVITHP